MSRPTCPHCGDPVTPAPSSDEVADLARSAFWDAVAAALPEYKTGDFPFDADHQFDQLTTAAVKLWMEMNAPAPRKQPPPMEGERQVVHEGLTVSVWRAEDGRPVIQVDGPDNDADLTDRGSPHIRIWLNDEILYSKE